MEENCYEVSLVLITRSWKYKGMVGTSWIEPNLLLIEPYHYHCASQAFIACECVDSFKTTMETIVLHFVHSVYELPSIYSQACCTVVLNLIDLPIYKKKQSQYKKN